MSCAHPRAPLHEAYAWADPLTTDTAATAFGGTTLRIAGPQATNPDTWDDPVVIREYGRVLVASASKVVAPRSGRFFFILASASGDATGLAGSASVQPPSKSKSTVDALPANGSFDVEAGALAGAVLAFSAKPDPKSGVALNVVALFDPDGLAVPTAGLVVRKGNAVTLDATLAKSGTYVLRVKGTGENETKLSYSLSLKQPKGGTYSAD